MTESQPQATSGTPSLTSDELELTLGANLRALRLARNIPQRVLAERAGIGTTALKHLEGGHGATVKTLVRVVRALGRDDWLAGVAPVATINPLHLVRDAQVRQRARGRAAKKIASTAPSAGGVAPAQPKPPAQR